MKQQIATTRETISKHQFVKVKGNKGNNKPDEGGFWTSTKTGHMSSAWTEFALTEGFYANPLGLHIYEIDVSPDARVLTINSREDYEAALNKYGMEANENHPLAVMSNSDRILDFNKLSKDYDALSVTEDGLYNNYMEFYGWDCESTIWFTMKHLKYKLVGDELL